MLQSDTHWCKINQKFTLTDRDQTHRGRTQIKHKHENNTANPDTSCVPLFIIQPVSFFFKYLKIQTKTTCTVIVLSNLI